MYLILPHKARKITKKIRLSNLIQNIQGIQSLSISLALFTSDRLKKSYDRGMANKNGQMGQSMKGNSKQTRPTAKEDLFIQMEIFMKEIGCKIRQRESADTLENQVDSMKEVGKMISQKDSVSSNGVTEILIRENLKKV